MKLFIVYNGYVGAGVMKCIVIAESEERAIELARAKYKQEASNKPYYNERFYSNLTAECLCEDTLKEFASDVDDE